MNNKPHSEETKKKISESNKGKKRSKEFCEKISEIRKQQHVKKSDETKKKISEKMKEIWRNRQVDANKNIEE